LGDENVLLLDEPTNDLDVTTLGVLEEALLEHDGCAFIISHDRRFLDRVATGILAFEKPDPDGPAIVTPVLGDWTHYERTQQARLASHSGAKASSAAGTTTTTATTTTTTMASKAQPAKRKRSNKEEREFAGIEATILLKETRREELAGLVQSPDVQKDATKAKAVSHELSTLEREIESLYARWQELSDLAPM
jgi:ATP-binding cassette subfamily F protein uup